MRSKISCFNKTLFKMDVKGMIAAIAVMSIIVLGMIIIPNFYVLSHTSQSDKLMVTSDVIRSMVDTLVNPVFIATICIVLATMIFAYGYNKRSSYMLHSMPIGRLEHFGSHCLAGLVTIISIEIICYVPLFIVAGGYGFLYTYVFLGMLETFVEILYFYALAVFCVVVCGYAFLSVVTFGVLNMIWWFINMVLSIFHYVLLYDPIVINYGSGAGFVFFEGTDFLFPAKFFAEVSNALSIAFDAQTVDGVGRFMHVLWMIFPAVFLYVVSAILYKRKKLEKVDEMVAFDWCKVVFRVLFTVCMSGLASCGAVLVTGSFGSIADDRTGVITIIIVLICVGGALGFMISEMLLQKTVHIFRSRKIAWIQGTASLGAVLVYVVILATGTIGPQKLPDPDRVECISIDCYSMQGGDESYILDAAVEPEAVKALAEKQKELINDKDLIESAKKDREISSDPIEGQVHMRLITESRNYDLLYTLEKNNKNKVFDSFLPYIQDGKTMKDVTFGTEADKMTPTSVEFSHFSESVKWNNKAFSVYIAPGNNEMNEEVDSSDTETDVASAMSGEKEQWKDVSALPQGDQTSDGVIILKNINLRELYSAILSDMKAGKVLPYAKDNAVVFGDERNREVICQIDVSVVMENINFEEINPYKIKGEDMTQKICITKDSANAIRVLKNAGAFA